MTYLSGLSSSNICANSARASASGSGEGGTYRSSDVLKSPMSGFGIRDDLRRLSVAFGGGVKERTPFATAFGGGVLALGLIEARALDREDEDKPVDKSASDITC